MQSENHSFPKPPPSEFWEDHRWSLDHAAEISEEYPNQWVAVCNKKVIAAGKEGGEVKRIALQKVGDRRVVIFFSEKGIRIYAG